MHHVHIPPKKKVLVSFTTCLIVPVWDVKKSAHHGQRKVITVIRETAPFEKGVSVRKFNGFSPNLLGEPIPIFHRQIHWDLSDTLRCFPLLPAFGRGSDVYAHFNARDGQATRAVAKEVPALKMQPESVIIPALTCGKAFCHEKYLLLSWHRNVIPWLEDPTRVLPQVNN